MHPVKGYHHRRKAKHNQNSQHHIEKVHFDQSQNFFLVYNTENQLREEGYRQCIIFSWALITGKLSLDDKDGLINFIKNLDWRLKFLLKNPKLLLMMLLMKSKLLNYKFYKVV